MLLSRYYHKFGRKCGRVIFEISLKVPKHENFSIAFFALSEPIWVCDVGTAKKSNFFIDLPLISMVLGFLPHTECAVNKKNISS